MTLSRDEAIPRSLPYRPCVGVVLINPERKVWIGKRREKLGTQKPSWQMPQGGIDRGEDPAKAALRELAEETGTGNAEIIGRTKDWLNYELPPERVGIALKGKYRGQKQIWFAMNYRGQDADFNILEPPGGHKPEFDEWRWADAQEVLDLIVSFKQPVYKAVFEQFRPFFS
jgi:putative (di)nucleoside polyphosphate hydrolase